MGDNPSEWQSEIEALRAGIDAGMTLIDTAEMYGGGRSERLVGEAIAGRRDEAFLVSKVSPQHASKSQVIRACENSLRRLDTEMLDLYLLHVPGNAPCADTIAGFEQLQADGKIGRFGISNFDLEESRQFVQAPGGDAVQVNQLLYNLNQRGIEWDLLPWLQACDIATMAYSPFDRVAVMTDPALIDFAHQRNMTAGQAALAWLINHEQVIAIPKASTSDRARENAAAGDIQLSAEDCRALDAIFPAPTEPRPLQIY